MAELYWITRLDYFNTAITVLLVILTLISVVYITTCVIVRQDDPTESERRKYNKFKKFTIILSLITFLCALIRILTPSTKEALIIYGAGGVIEYVQSNETVKELPDKAVQCLDKLLDEYLTEENTN